MVDLLSLELVQDEADDDWFGLDRVRIRVNGIALRELAAAAGLDDDFCYPTPYLLGVGHLLPKTNSLRQAAKDWFPGERTALLADGCGQPGCDSLLATIHPRPPEAHPPIGGFAVVVCAGLIPRRTSP